MYSRPFDGLTNNFFKEEFLLNESLNRLAGWSAYVNAAAFLISLVAVTIYFSMGGFWGTLSDVASVIWVLSFMPLAWLGISRI